MTDTTRTSDDLWREDGEDDDEQTQVARNPLLRAQQAQTADQSRVQQTRSLSSFGTPRSSWPPAAEGAQGSARPSLYDRLLQTGALDDALSVEAKHESSRPLSSELSRSAGHVLPPPPDLRDLAEALEGGEGRDSAEQLRDSDVQVLAAASQTPTRPLRPVPTPSGGRSMPMPLPRPNGNGQMSSILLGPGASTRNDATERFSHMPSTHPLANSLAPTAPSVRPVPMPEKRTPAWLVAVAAVALVGAGAAIGRYRAGLPNQADESRTVAVAAPTAAEPIAEATAVAPPAPENAALAPAEPVAAPEVPSETKGADEASAESAEETPAEARKRERDLRRAERAAAAAAALSADSTPAADVSPSPSEVPAEANAIAAPAPARVKPAAPSGPLPAQPSREQVVATMDAMQPELARCVGEKHGSANVTMTVRSAGTVSYAIVGGSFAGTPEGSCIARVIKLAQFPAFSDASIRVTYPFQL